MVDLLLFLAPQALNVDLVPSKLYGITAVNGPLFPTADAWIRNKKILDKYLNKSGSARAY